jgi:hypothetical protein
MPTAEEYGALSIAARVDRLNQTPGELERAISGKTDGELSARPDANNWGAKEIVWGRLTLADWVARLAAHDDNHLTQLHRTLEGRA